MLLLLFDECICKFHYIQYVTIFHSLFQENMIGIVFITYTVLESFNSLVEVLHRHKCI